MAIVITIPDRVRPAINVAGQSITAIDLSKKVDKVYDAPDDNIALFDGTGNIKDSGKNIEALTNDIIAEVNISSGIKTYYSTFAIEDWVSGAGIYYINFNHDLQTIKTIVEVKESTSKVLCDVITVSNMITKIQIPYDQRFIGNITIIAI
jgi:hypothetical protein